MLGICCTPGRLSTLQPPSTARPWQQWRADSARMPAITARLTATRPPGRGQSDARRNLLAHLSETRYGTGKTWIAQVHRSLRSTYSENSRCINETYRWP